MKSRLGIVIGATVTVMAVFVAGRYATTSASKTNLADQAAPVDNATIRTTYLAGIRAFDSALVRLDTALARFRASPSVDSVRGAFFEARRTYKAIETLVEYYAPVTAKTINGPALDRPDDESPGVVVPPTGLQVIEASLFPVAEQKTANEMRKQVAILRVSVTRLREIAGHTQLTNAHLFDASRLEITRVMTLGMGGFDAPVSGNSIRESSAALGGVRSLLQTYERSARKADEAAWNTMDQDFRQARATLDSAKQANDFDRFTFITTYAERLARHVDHVRRIAGVTLPDERRPWRNAALTVFEPNAFDPAAYAPLDAVGSNTAMEQLGCSLFSDTRLSGDGTRSCVSCHAPERAFTDGRARRAEMPGRAQDPQARNTPTVLNIAFQPASFADGRVAFLEDQIPDVIGNPGEMGSDIEMATTRIARVAEYQRRFAEAFVNSSRSSVHSVSDQRDRAVTSHRVRRALAAYLRSLRSMNSRFDRAMRGDSKAMNAQERQGFNVFMGKAKCGSCHFAPLFGGSVPPAYTESEVEVLGIPARMAEQHATVDPDIGRERITREVMHRHAFRTASLRNVALTAPYMHNGAYPTLEAVIDFYNRGGGAGIGIHLPNQTLPPDRLGLTHADRDALIAFLGTLTDTVGTTRRCVPPGLARSSAH